MELRGIDVSKVEKRTFRDVEGKIWHPGAKVEFNMYLHDREHILVEVRFKPDSDDLRVIESKVKFMKEVQG